jgi:aminoethylphosphonate catabolism LysR family transcriptional regulator
MIHSQLRAFHFVATEGSFTRAAAALCVTQPTLSMQVKDLEERYQVRLFNRRGQRIEMTEMGRDLLAITQGIFDLEQNAEELMSAARVLEAGRLRVGADSTTHIIPVIASFAAAYPGVKLALATGSARTTLNDLLEYRTDIALMADPMSDPRLETHPFSRDRIVTIVPAGHRLSRSPSISMKNLLKERLILRESGSATRRIFDEATRALGIAHTEYMEIGSQEGVYEAIAVGLGVSVTSEADLSRDNRIAAIPIDDPPLIMTEYLVCLKDRLRLGAVGAFIAIAEQHSNIAASA